jgi:hypothetical protein
VKPREAGAIQKISDELLSLNRNWAAPLFQRPRLDLECRAHHSIPNPQPGPYFNEKRLSSEDAVFQDRLDPAGVLEFLRRVPEDEQGLYEFRSFSEFFHPL